MTHSRRTICSCIFALLLAIPAGAAHADDDDYPRAISGPVEARVLKVRDGDTVEVEAFVWPMQAVQVAVRLKGIDAPEKRGRCEAEKAAAEIARDRLVALIGSGNVTLTGISGDKYFGRVLATLSVPGQPDLGRVLLREGLVVRYEGGKRRDWCDGTLPADLSAVDAGGRRKG